MSSHQILGLTVMVVRVLDAANPLCKISGWTLNQMELYKLQYLAHMFHLGSQNTPLVRADFEVREFGPVHPKLHKAVMHYGSRTITSLGRNRMSLPLKSEKTALDVTYSEIRLLSASKLLALTHWKEGALRKNYRPGLREVVIPQEDISGPSGSRGHLRLGQPPVS